MLAGSTRDSYKPRRANLSTWLKDAPDYVLDVFDHPKSADRYTVLLCGDFIGRYDECKPHSTVNTFVSYLSMSGAPTHPQGVSMWGEMKAWQATEYRYHNARRHRIAWNDLPANVRAHVIARCED